MTVFDCAACQDALLAYSANLLGLEERLSVEAHLAHCVACSAIAAELRLIDQALHTIDSTLPTDLRTEHDWQLLTAQRMPISTLPEQRSNYMMQEPTSSSVDLTVSPVTARHPPRTRTWGSIPIAAALCLVLAAAAIFGVFHNAANKPGIETASGCKTAPPSHSTAAAPVGTNLPAYTSLQHMSMVTPGNIWAVGEKYDSHRQAPIQGVIYHLAACQWQQYPVGISLAKTPLYSISMVSADEGWAVGSLLKDGLENSLASLSAVVVLHYSHGMWQQVSIPGTAAFVEGQIAMVSPDEGWLTLHGPYTITNTGNTSVGALLHYQHGIWSPVILPGNLGQNVDDTAVTPVGPDDAWFTSSTQNTQTDARNDFLTTIIHDQHGKLTTYRLAKDISASGFAFPSATDGWMTGMLTPPSTPTGTQKPVLLHFDGNQWTNATLPPSVDENLHTSYFVSISLISTQEGFIFGYMLTEGTPISPLIVYHLHQGQWQKMVLPNWPALENSSASAILMVSADEAWAFVWKSTSIQIGAVGYISPSTTILHYLNGQWSIAGQ